MWRNKWLDIEFEFTGDIRLHARPTIAIFIVYCVEI